VAVSRFGQLTTCMKKGYNAKMNFYLQSEQYSSLAVQRKCSICPKDHDIYRCPSLLSMTVGDRWSHVKSKGVCFVCLKQSHRASECKSTKRCNVEDPLESNPNVESHCGYTKSLGHHVCLGMIPIRLKSEHAEVVGYALLDNGSDATLIRSDCLKPLGLKTEQTAIVTNAIFKVHLINQTEHI
ncbi:Gag-Pol polyprotein, partial [Schistosoma japonicum]